MACFGLQLKSRASFQVQLVCIRRQIERHLVEDFIFHEKSSHILGDWGWKVRNLQETFRWLPINCWFPRQSPRYSAKCRQATWWAVSITSEFELKPSKNRPQDYWDSFLLYVFQSFESSSSRQPLLCFGRNQCAVRIGIQGGDWRWFGLAWLYLVGLSVDC
jgi:hypothetical protein